MTRHLPVAIVVGIVTVTAWTHAAQAPPADAYSSEDRAVLTAVIDHTIRPKVQKVTRQPSVVVYLIDHTAPICDKWREPRNQPFCMFPVVEGNVSAGGRLLGPTAADSDGAWRAVVPLEANREELFASIKERNAARHTLPISDARDVKLLAAPLIETPSGPASPIYSVFSLPGYSSAGHAVVSGFIDCGDGCGGVLVWLLEKRGGDWQVRGRDMSLLFPSSAGRHDPDAFEFGRTTLYNGAEVIYNPPVAPLGQPASR